MPRILAQDLKPTERAFLVNEIRARLALARDAIAADDLTSASPEGAQMIQAVLDASFAGFGFAFDEARQRGSVASALEPRSDASSFTQPTRTIAAHTVVLKAAPGYRKMLAPHGFRWMGQDFVGQYATADAARDAAAKARSACPDAEILIHDKDGKPLAGGA